MSIALSAAPSARNEEVNKVPAERANDGAQAAEPGRRRRVRDKDRAHLAEQEEG